MNQVEFLSRLKGIEWNDFECKCAQRGVPQDAYNSVFFFENMSGGWLVFGVSEWHGKLNVTGVEAPDDVQSDFLSVLHSGKKISRAIALDAHCLRVDARHVFAFQLPEFSRSEKPVHLMHPSMRQNCRPCGNKHVLRDQHY